MTDKKSASKKTLDDYDVQLEHWHEHYEGNLPLHTFLGLTWAQYKALVEAKSTDIVVKDVIEGLSKEEIRVIETSRIEAALHEKKTRLYHVSVSAASAFLNWQSTSGMGLTFSTFIDDFDCCSQLPDEFKDDVKVMYNAVKSILDAAAEHANAYKRTHANWERQ
jgi:hypothetical protein